MVPSLHDLLADIRFHETQRALLEEKHAEAARHLRRHQPTRPPSRWGLALRRWRLRTHARRARLRKRHYATPWLEDLHHIVEAQRRREG